MNNLISAFQLGSSTVVTLPKKLGIKPGAKFKVKKTRQGLSLKLDKKESLANILRRTQGAWADTVDWTEWDKREKANRKLELEASERRKKAW